VFEAIFERWAEAVKQPGPRHPSLRRRDPGGNPQGATSTFDVRFRVDEPASATLTGQSTNPFALTQAGPLLLLAGEEVILSAPNPGYVPFSFETTLTPGPLFSSAGGSRGARSVARIHSDQLGSDIGG
jgi:hypothetical protein